MKDMLEINRDEQQLRKLMMRLQHMLHRQIAEVNHRQVFDELEDFFTDANIVIMSRDQFNIFKEYEKNLLNMNSIFPKGNLINIDEDKKNDQ
jgi:hypothetical protein